MPFRTDFKYAYLPEMEFQAVLRVTTSKAATEESIARMNEFILLVGQMESWAGEIQEITTRAGLSDEEKVALIAHKVQGDWTESLMPSRSHPRG
jgi:hypothetical protein